jgi:hypothetical protein
VCDEHHSAPKTSLSVALYQKHESPGGDAIQASAAHRLDSQPHSSLGLCVPPAAKGLWVAVKDSSNPTTNSTLPLAEHIITYKRPQESTQQHMLNPHDEAQYHPRANWAVQSSYRALPISSTHLRREGAKGMHD